MATSTRRGQARPGVPDFGGGRVQNMPTVKIGGSGTQSMRVLSQVLDQWSQSMFARYDAGVAATSEIEGAADGLHGTVKQMDLSTTRGASYTRGAIATLSSTMDVQAMTTIFALEQTYGNNPGQLAAKIKAYGDGAYGELAKINPPAAAAWRERFMTRALPTIAGARDRYLTSSTAAAKQADKDREAIENEGVNRWGADLFSDDPARSSAASKAIEQLHFERTQTYGSSIGGFQVPAEMDEYRPVLSLAASASGVPAPLLMAMGWRESRGSAGAVSDKGATGLLQVMPPTGREQAKKLGLGNLLALNDAEFATALKDPKVSAILGASYMGEQMRTFGGDAEVALIAYNAGPDAADRFLEAGRDYAVIPAETRGYVAEVLPNYEKFQGGDATGMVATIEPGQGKVNGSTYESKFYSWGGEGSGVDVSALGLQPTADASGAPMPLQGKTDPFLGGPRSSSSLRNDRFPDATMDKSVLDLLEVVTDDFGHGALKIESGYRSPDYNAKVSFTGDNGPHTRGEAIDIDVSDLSDEEKTQLVSTFIARGARGVGHYPGETSIHVDMREGQGNGPEGLALWYGKNQSYTSGAAWFRKGVDQGIATKQGQPTIPAMAVGGSYQAIQNEKEQEFADHVLTVGFKSWFSKQDDKSAAYLKFVNGETKLRTYDENGKVLEVDVRAKLSVKALDALEADLRTDLTFQNSLAHDKQAADDLAVKTTSDRKVFDLTAEWMKGTTPLATLNAAVAGYVNDGTMTSDDGTALLTKFATDKPADVSDQAIKKEALRRLYTGEDIRPFLLENTAALSGTDQSSLLSANETRNVSKNGDLDANGKFYYGLLDDELTPDGLMDKFDFLGYADSRKADALDEYRRRVLAGEDPEQVRTNVRQRARRDLASSTQSEIDRLVIPRFAVRDAIDPRLVNVQATAAAIKKGLDNKQISAEEFSRQALLLQEWATTQSLAASMARKAAEEKAKAGQ